MEHEFWYGAWAKERQGWNQASANVHLRCYWEQFVGEKEKEKVFVPLCGQSIDMLWLNEAGHATVGVELDQNAVKRFYEQNQLNHSISQTGNLRTYTSNSLVIHTGDYFQLLPLHLMGASLVYDRAALIALPHSMRQRYVDKLALLLETGSKILLISMVYDESEMSGPPFSVREEEIMKLFEYGFEVEKVASSSDHTLLGGLAKRGLSALTENVYFITRNSLPANVI